MSDEIFLEQIKREAKQLSDEIIKNNLRTDPQWWEVRFVDFRKKYNIEKACLTKEPSKVSFTIGFNDFEYIGNPECGRWDFELCSDDSENFMCDLLDAGIITEDGKVNYEVEYGLEVK